MAYHLEDLQWTLLAAEEQGWPALSEGSGAAYYQLHLTDDALMVFPFGVLTREETIAAMEAAPPWASFHLEDARVVPLTENSAVLIYRATALRTGQEPFVAHVVTVYVKRDGVWKPAFHQQTPADS